MSEKILPAITDEFIREWKEKNPGKKLFDYKTNDNRRLILRSPSISELEASSALAKSKPVQSNKLIANACAIAGDASILDDDYAFIGLSEKLSQIIVKVEGELTEL